MSLQTINCTKNYIYPHPVVCDKQLDIYFLRITVFLYECRNIKTLFYWVYRQRANFFVRYSYHRLSCNRIYLADTITCNWKGSHKNKLQRKLLSPLHKFPRWPKQPQPYGYILSEYFYQATHSFIYIFLNIYIQNTLDMIFTFKYFQQKFKLISSRMR